MTEVLKAAQVQQEAAGEANEWHDHCKNAVRRFVVNAVVIDNQPVTKTTGAKSPAFAAQLDDGTGATYEEVTSQGKDLEDGIELDSSDSSDHELNIRTISDAFAQEEIACAFVLPDDTDDNDDRKISRIMSASRQADMVVIDWYLQDSDPTITRRVIKAIAEEDSKEKGRMRLICVYTGQPAHTIPEITRDVIKDLNEGGLSVLESREDQGSARGEHFCLLVLNKTEVKAEELPFKLLDAMASLTEGLLPSFALAAVAAVRRNMHHIVSRFSSDLDAAYVANRLITNPPNEVAELMRELFVSECDTALGLEKVADNFLSKEQIEIWLNHYNHPVSKPKYKVDIVVESEKRGKKRTKTEGREISIDREFLGTLLQEGIEVGKIRHKDFGLIGFPENKRDKVSAALHRKGDNSKGERKFARFAALKREAFANTKLISEENWTPSLTLGSLLRLKSEVDVDSVDTVKKYVHKYYYCLTPACETLRLHGEEKTFLMLELEDAQGSANLVVSEENNAQKKLYINPKPSNLRTFRFKGDLDTGRVQAEKVNAEEPGKFIFVYDNIPETDDELLWLGEVRRNRASRDMAELNRNWLRFGIKDSEYLRLAGKGEISI